MNATAQADRVVFWHRELPPLDAEALGTHTVEATSTRVPATLAQRDLLWDRCCGELMAQARGRIEQEVARLGGQYARVLEEAIDVRHDYGKGEAWLHGRFEYELYGRPLPCREGSGGKGAHETESLGSDRLVDRAELRSSGL